jgi:hypothetical protein
MDGRVLWDLNLDAEYELATIGSYTRSRAAQGFIDAHRSAASDVLGAGDVLLEEFDQRRDLGGPLRGRAWCPTPSALARLRAIGATPEPAPSVEVLRAVNDRAFCASLGQTLEFARHCTSLDQLRATLAGPDGPSDWLAKRAFGLAGRGRRKLRRSECSAADERWLIASLREGGVQLEPWLSIEAEFAVNGELTPDGELCLGAPRYEQLDEHGSWKASRDATAADLSGEEAAQLIHEARRVAAALSARGYFGPFGVDSYRYHDPASGLLRLQPRSEVNARYTMGWTVGA